MPHFRNREGSDTTSPDSHESDFVDAAGSTQVALQNNPI